MSDKNSLDELWEMAAIYYYRKPIIIIGIILLIIFIAGYYKFAVPVYEEAENRMSYFNYTDSWVIDSTTGEKVDYATMNPTRRELARCLADNGYVSPENKEKLERLSDELIVKTLGRSYSLEEFSEDGKTYYKYYIGTIRMESKMYAAYYIDEIIRTNYKEALENEKANIVVNN